MFNLILNATLTVKDVIQMKNGIITNVNVSVKPMARAKKIIVKIPAYAFVKRVDI